MKILTVESEVFHADGRTDGQIDIHAVVMELIVAFCKLAKAPKSEV